MIDSGVRFLIVDLPAEKLLKVADAARDGLVFNAGAPDERLREEDCRANVIHTAPSRAMLADGLAEYLIWKRWRKWLLVVGSHPEDVALGAAYERAAKKFGAKIVEKRIFEDTGGGRRSDSGVVQTQRQMPVFTQKAPDYDVLIAADENDVFARLPALPHLGPAPGRRFRGPHAGELGRLARIVGRPAAAEPLSAHVSPRHDRARQPGLGRHADDRRRHQPDEIRRREVLRAP